MAWTIPFETIGGSVLRIEIQGTLEDITLKGSAQPFVIDIDDDEDLFTAVRTTSGNIGIVADWQTVKEIVGDATPVTRRVSLLTGTGSDTQLLWSGFLRCESYDFDYTPFVQEYQLPIVSKLGLAENLLMKKEFGFSSFVDILEEIGSWNYVYMPNNFGHFLHSYVIKRSNYLDQRDYPDVDGISYDSTALLDIVEDMCNYMGWQVVEVGADLYFLSNDNCTQYRKYDWATFIDTTKTVFSTVDRQVLDLPALISNDNVAQIVSGKNTIDVVGEINEYDTDVYQFNPENDLDYAGQISTYKISDACTYKCRVYENQEGLEIQAYQFGKVYNKACHVNNFKYENCSLNNEQYVGGCLANECLKGDDYESGYINRIIIYNATATNVLVSITPKYYIPTVEGAYVLIKMSSVKLCRYANEMFSDNFTGMIRGYVKCGDYYYHEDIDSDGGWSTSKQPYNFRFKDGKPVTQDRSELYTEEEGFFIPWGDLENVMEDSKLTVQFCYVYETDSSTAINRYIDIEGLTITAHYDNVFCYGLPDKNEWKKDLGNGFSDEESVKCGLTYQFKSQVGRGIMTIKPYDERPEVYLGERLAAYHAKSHSLYKMMVRSRDMVSPINTYTIDGEECAVIAQSLDPRYEELTLTLLALT